MLGLALPEASAYSYSVAGFGPFETLDEALSADGIGARIPREIRSSDSEGRSIELQAP